MATRATTALDFKGNLRHYCNEVSNFGDTLFITRKHHQNLVVISEEEFNAWQETNYLKKDKLLLREVKKQD